MEDTTLKLRVPRFLVPRRRYEVDGSMWLVKFGRSQEERIIQFEENLSSFGEESLRRSRKLEPIGRSLLKAVAQQAHKPVLFVQWGRMPKEWELSFVSKMKSVESLGIPFPEVLQTDLPLVMGEAPSGVLMRWVGKKARRDPKTFVKVVSAMFGSSGKRIITSLEASLDPEKMLDSHKEPEHPFQSVIDAIQRADAEKSEQEDPAPRRQERSSHA
jgi:hypothetical protein